MTELTESDTDADTVSLADAREHSLLAMTGAMSLGAASGYLCWALWLFDVATWVPVVLAQVPLRWRLLGGAVVFLAISLGAFAYDARTSPPELVEGR